MKEYHAGRRIVVLRAVPAWSPTQGVNETWMERGDVVEIADYHRVSRSFSARLGEKETGFYEHERGELWDFAK